MIVGLVPCDGGRIELDGEDITSLPMHARARRGLGYLPQEPSIFRRMTVVDNVMAILETRSDLDDAARDEALESLLEELHVAHLRDNMGMSLSGGERRRVEIARALAADPAFILLDEPFAGVDPLSVHDIQRIARHLAERGIGVLITDHNVRETFGNLRPGLHRQPGHDPGFRICRRDPCKSRGPQGLLGAGFQALTARNRESRTVPFNAFRPIS